MDNLKIDPEFRDKIPPLTEAEYEQLKENILTAGEVYEPIVVWNGTIIDGHNRWKVVQENPSISYRVRAMDFPDKWAAFEWMYKNQLGRRNLTEAQREMIIGQMYEAAKKTHGGDRRSDDFSSAENRHLKANGRTANKVAADIGVGKERVKNAAHYVKGIDAMKSLGDEGKEAAQKILSGKADVTKQTVRNFNKMSTAQQQEVVRNILDDKSANPPKQQESPVPHSEPKVAPAQSQSEDSIKQPSLKEQIASTVASMRKHDTVPVKTVDSFIIELCANITDSVERIRDVLVRNSTILNEENARERAKEAFSGFHNSIRSLEGLL